MERLTREQYYEVVDKGELIYAAQMPKEISTVSTKERYLEFLKNQLRYKSQDAGEVNIPKADPDYEGEGNG